MAVFICLKVEIVKGNLYIKLIYAYEIFFKHVLFYIYLYYNSKMQYISARP